MAVETVGEIFFCEVCKNEVIVTKVGGGTLVCCGKDMVKVEETDDVVIEIEEEDESEE